ncbi:hypothetical protein [Gemmiger sp. An120]|nr:hypothetical protein [Gemmiger sp. An120]
MGPVLESRGMIDTVRYGGDAQMFFREMDSTERETAAIIARYNAERR